MAKVGDDGAIDLVENGKKNLYDEIQSHKDSVDLNLLLQRFNNGEVDVLSRMQGTYADLSNMPKTYADMLNLIKKGEADFLSLPVDVRAKFDHSFEKWLVTFGSQDWIVNMKKDSVVQEEKTDILAEKGEKVNE
nr:unnamed protein product [uncultured bacterium]